MSLILPQRSMLSVGEAAFTPLEFHDSATDQANSSGNSTVNYPAGTAEGDLLFLVGQQASISTFSDPSGWSLLSTRDLFSWYAAIWWRIAGAETSVQLNSSGGTGGGAAVFVYKGSPPDSINITKVDNSFAANANPGAVTAQADSVVAVALTLSNNNAITPPSGYTERLDTNPFGATGGRIGWFDKAITVDGSEDPGATTHSAATNTVWTIAPVYS